MKRLKYLICILFVSIIFFVGCSGGSDEDFVHDTKYYTDDGYDMEFAVKNIDRADYSVHVKGAGCLTFEIEFNNKSQDAEKIFVIYLADFNFYFTKPQSIFEMCLYYPESETEVESISVKPGKKQTVLLRIFFNNSKNEDFKVEDDCFVLEFCDVRI